MVFRPTREQYILAAKAEYESDDIEIDAGEHERAPGAAKVSINDKGGAWVRAWVFVTDDDARDYGDAEEA